jgi:hypothetical protein
MSVPEDQLKEAGRHSFRNKDEIMASEICGCFCCYKIYPPSEIKVWYKEESTYDGITGFTATCPYCSMDTVIGSKSGLPIEHEFLVQI